MKDGEIKTAYIKEEKIKAVSLENLFLYVEKKPPGTVLKDYLLMTIWGQKHDDQKTPSFLMIGFTASYEKECKVPDSIDFHFVFEADGEKRKVDSVFSFTDPEGDGSCKASLMAKLPYTTITKIAGAKKVKLIMANYRIQLTKQQLILIQRLVKEIS